MTIEHDIVGINEIAEMAKVSRQAVVNWRSRAGDFPRPIKELASGPVFRSAQIRAWLRRNKLKLDVLENGPQYYERLMSFRNDSDDLADCVKRVVDQLVNSTTSDDRPGMLLGKIQSGKTRAFIGVIASAFDHGFDIALVLTKGTKTLSAQTVSRLSADFKEFIEEDELMVMDIMKLPGKLTQSELRRKIVIVAKKQVQNLSRLIDFVDNQDKLQRKKVLIVDDEADLASVRFVRKKDDPDTVQGKIAEQIDELRELSDRVAFLQVTATPYSLYLQPENYEDSENSGDFIFKPKRPAFTELLPIHDGYVGGDHYFGAFEDDDPRSMLIVEVEEQEQHALRKPDQRRISEDRILQSQNTIGLRRAIITFVVAAGVRQWQQRETGERQKKYSMVIHNDTQRSAHAWQSQVVFWLYEAITGAAKENPESLHHLFEETLEDLSSSILAHGKKMPPYEEAFDFFIDALLSDDVVVEKVNSDNDVMALLDEKAELKLRTPYNIFVGGNILDRGITIPNLISFYYGRNPRVMQSDTVLQHSRMYGNRHPDDLAVTRLYTSRAVFDRLYAINDFERTLRNAFENGAHDKGVVFIRNDANRRIRPCAPNKVLLSEVVSVSRDTLLLPSDFQTKGSRAMQKMQASLDKIILPEWCDAGEFVCIDREKAHQIIEVIQQTMEFDSVKFDWEAMHGVIDYYSRSGDGKILLLAETGRELTRDKSGDKSGLSILGTALRRKVIGTQRTRPALILLQQKGGRERGWTAHSFWWPILAAPTNAEPCVFATKTAA